jgi:hypothetical protein
MWLAAVLGLVASQVLTLYELHRLRSTVGALEQKLDAVPGAATPSSNAPLALETAAALQAERVAALIAQRVGAACAGAERSDAQPELPAAQPESPQAVPDEALDVAHDILVELQGAPARAESWNQAGRALLGIADADLRSRAVREILAAMTKGDLRPPVGLDPLSALLHPPAD